MPRTIRVRIAVAVGNDGEWSSCGFSTDTMVDDDLAAFAVDGLESDRCLVHWVEADIPVPEAVTVEGEVVE